MTTPTTTVDVVAVHHPGDLLHQWLTNQHMRPTQFAARSGLGRKKVDKILTANMHVTADLARILCLHTGIDVDVWLHTQQEWTQWCKDRQRTVL